MTGPAYVRDDEGNLKQREWNPRYVAYARAHGNDPEAQLAADRIAWPGGVMAGFTLWIGEQWAEWRANTGHLGRDYILTEADHADFDERIGA